MKDVRYKNQVIYCYLVPFASTSLSCFVLCSPYHPSLCNNHIKKVSSLSLSLSLVIQCSFVCKGGVNRKFVSQRNRTPPCKKIVLRYDEKKIMKHKKENMKMRKSGKRKMFLKKKNIRIKMLSRNTHLSV